MFHSSTNYRVSGRSILFFKLVSSNQISYTNMLDDSKDEVFIDTVIEGGSKFESTDVFMKRVEELI